MATSRSLYNGTAMAELTEADLKDGTSNYQSYRGVWDVLIGEDAARLVIAACRSGDDTSLQVLLAQPPWDKTMLERTHTIYYASRLSSDPDDVRQVSARSLSQLERALNVAAESGHAPCVSTILSYAKQKGFYKSDFVHRLLIGRVIQGGHAAVLKELLTAEPSLIHTQINHGAMPLFEAVRFGRPDVVAVLLELGADPLRPWDPPRDDTGYRVSLMSRAAMAHPAVAQMLLDKDPQMELAGTAALHSAARIGSLDTMQLLMQHGAEVNETMPNWSQWTPMHFAASKGQVDAMELLEENGARLDVEDKHGKTPEQLLEEYRSGAATKVTS